ncbi:hypothetical protein JCM33374_g4243 [Metschnikowia sp. JCM 33374]|nr:hypothetical protein JCM33374_g4243 [Metschnikowia sp. JCM 33374]
MFGRDFSSPTLRSKRVIAFKIPKGDKQLQIITPPSDRSSTWEMVKTLLPHEQKSIEPANEHEAHVLKAFRLPPDEILSIPPLKYLPTPFTYHSTVNGDTSYINQPRLSVSKLLTNAWCELRSFYEIYAGSPRSPPSSSMKAGTKYHAKLEAKEHPKLDDVSLKSELKTFLSKHPKETIKELVRTRSAFEFAQNWTEQTVFRSICASHTKVARELFIHGFLDIGSGSLVTEENKLRDGVLVNGIADIVKIDMFNTSKYLDDTDLDDLSSESSTINLPEDVSSNVLDLTFELPKAKETMNELAKDHYLHMRDVKTRRSNTVPDQLSVINGAKLQCMYYAIFLHNLSRDADFAYESCLENIRRRRIDPDEPISIALATELLVANFRTLALDYLRLAKGDSIGFPTFDEYSHNSRNYSLSQFIDEKDLRWLIEVHYGEELDISGVDLAPLFSNWKIPLTLRYFSARTGQAFNIYEAFKPSSVCVEYHNSVKQQLIARQHYPFDMHEMKESIAQTSKFWDGRRRPSHTDDPSMCNYCNFKKRCSAMNSGIGPEAARLIHELQEW